MKIRFNREEKLLNRMILHSADNNKAIGLLTGQTGVILVVVRYARQKQHPQLEAVADFLFDNVMKQVEQSVDLSFAYGLSGICWAVEYLVQHGIMPGPAEEICGSMNEAISSISLDKPVDFSLDTGLLGLWHCVLARLQGNLLSGLKTPFPPDWLERWFDVLDEFPEKFPQGSASKLRNLMHGDVEPESLDFRQFIELPKHLDINDLSLKTGAAGYIESKYLG